MIVLSKTLYVFEFSFNLSYILGDETNFTTVGSAVTTITSNLNDITPGLRQMAALLGDGSDSINLLKVWYDKLILTMLEDV